MNLARLKELAKRAICQGLYPQVALSSTEVEELGDLAFQLVREVKTDE